MDIYPFFIIVYIFILGTVIGSFLNVVVYRMPRGLSIVSPPSSCPQCGQRLKWWQLVPIASYLFQQGKCWYCQSKISLRYVMVELVTGILFIEIFLVTGFNWITVVYWILISGLITVTFIDWYHFIIPDRINLMIFATGLTASLLDITIPFNQALLGSLIGAGLLWALAVLSKGGMGGGDIKLAFALGIFTGWQLMLLLLFIASLTGAVYGLAQIVFLGTSRGKPIPFGPFLSVAGVIVLLWGQAIIQYYLAIF